MREPEVVLTCAAAALASVVVNEKHKLEGLQAARAIAALSVAYFHSYVVVRGAFPESAWQPIPGLKAWGFLGVNFFFAISGFVICLVLSRPSFTVRGFLTRRAFRLYPMYWVTLAVVTVMIAYGKYPPQPPGHFLYSMTLLPQQGAPAYDISWTLEREMVFYALAVLTVPIAGIYGLAATLAALAFFGWRLGNPWSFHLVSTVQADFLAGVVVFALRAPLRRLSGSVPLVAGCALLWFTRAHDFPFATPLSMAAILAGMINLRVPWSRLPLRWLVLAGDASYSIYLLHYVVFALAATWAVNELTTLPAWACEPWRFGWIVVCCLISYGTWRLIERPMIELGDGLAYPHDGSRRSNAPASAPVP